MGNTACSTPTVVSALSVDDLRGFSADDEVCLTLLQQQFPNSEIGKLIGLDMYNIGTAVPKTSLKPEAQELAMLCLQDDKVKLSEKHTDVVSSIMGQIKFLREGENSSEAKYEKTEVQVLCRVYDALLREEEREKKRLATKSSEREKQKKEKSVMPVVGRVGLDFSINVLLAIVEAVGQDKPQLVRQVIDIASRVVSGVEPLSMVGYGDSVSESITNVARMFNGVLSGKISGLEKSDELKAMTALMGLALASGSLGACLSLAQRFLSLSADESWPGVLNVLVPMLRKLHELAPSSGSKMSWNWNTGKTGPDIVISNEDKTITRTNSSAWGNNLSEQTVTSGIHYVEFHIDRNSSSCLLVGIAKVGFSDWGSKSSVAGVICYQADGDTYVDSSSSGNIGSYTAGDRVGMLLDMEEHKLTFFKNGIKMSREAFAGVPEEIALIICFGGSDQFVSITEDPELPGDLVGIIGTQKKKNSMEGEVEEVPVFRKTADEILKDPQFFTFTKADTTIGSESPYLIATFLLASLDIQAERIFGMFELDKIKSNYSSKAKFDKSQGLAVDVSGTTFALVLDMLNYLKDIFCNQSWQALDFKLASWSCLSCLRILRNHIFAGKALGLTETESGLTSERRDVIRTVLNFFSKLTIESLRLDPTPENSLAVDTLASTAAIVTIHSFELYYPTLNSQLDFLIEGMNSTSQEAGEKRLVAQIMQKVGLPLNLLLAFDTSSEENRMRVKKFMDMLLKMATEQSLAYIQEGKMIDKGLISTFFIAQNVLFAHTAKTNMSEESFSIFKPFLFEFLSSIEFLINKAIEVTGGTITDVHEKIFKETLLGRHTSILLKALSLFQFDVEFNTHLISKLQTLISLLNQLHGGRPQRVKGTRIETCCYESAHPYASNANLTHKVETPKAIDYILTFDPRCKSERTHDKLELWKEEEKTNKVFQWDGPDWPKTPIRVKQPKLFFTFQSDSSSTDWGWKIDISARIVIDVMKDCWINEVRSNASALLASICTGMITGSDIPSDPEVAKLLTNPLLKSGLRDIGLARLAADIKEIPDAMKELITKLQIDTPKTVTEVSSRYSDIPILEELVVGSTRTVATFSQLKQQAKIDSAIASLGGEELDQAERAFFAVFLAYFELTDTFASMTESLRETGEMFQYIVNMATQIRQWAHSQSQKAEKPYSEISKLIIEKCTILLNLDYRRALTETGINKVLSSLMATVQQKALEEPSNSGMASLKAGSKWITVHKAMYTIKLLNTLLRMKYSHKDRSGANDTLDDKREFQTVYGFVMELMDSQIEIAAILKEITIRRQKAITRAVGLELICSICEKTLKGKTLGIVSEAFVESFSHKSGKKHFTAGVEGVDFSLISSIQNSFFKLYQHLFNNFKQSSVESLDCTSGDSFQNLMKLLDALSFPLESQDSLQLLSLDVRDSCELLLTWTKGAGITEKIPIIFDLSKVVVDLKVFAESEYSARDGAKSVPLRPEMLKSDDHSGSEEEDEEEGGDKSGDQDGDSAPKRVLELIYGSTDIDFHPITDVIIASPTSEIDGYTLIQGNVNEVGEELSLFVKRGEPAEGGKYLKSITVTGRNPVTFAYSYEPYSAFLIEDSNSDDKESRKTRRNIFRYSSWLLFKLFTYLNAAKNDDSQAITVQHNRQKLQDLFSELLFSQLKWTTPQKKDSDSLALRKLLSGKNWRNAVPIVELKKNPIVEWIEIIREDSEEFLSLEKSYGSEPTSYDVSLLDIINDYLTTIDPTLKGVLPTEEVSKSIPEEYLNSKKEVDFFCFLRYAVKNIESEAGPFWCKIVKTSPVYQSLPTDYYQAKEIGGEITVSSILNVCLSTIFRSDSNSFIAYLELFKASEVPGIVTGGRIPQNTPSEFLNEDKELDFFTSVKAICANEDKFSDYFREIKWLIGFYSGLPESCRRFYTGRLSDVQSEYQASLLLLLYQCCHSTTMLKSLSKANYMLELLKYMFMGTLQTATISFRIVRELILTQHSPESFRLLWTSLPKGRLRAELGAEASSDFVTVLLTFIGIRALTHTRSLKYAYINLEKLERLGFESLSLLQRISQNSRWSHQIITTGMKLVAKMIDGTVLPSKSDSLVGFLAYMQSFATDKDDSQLEWNRVKLTGLNTAAGWLVRSSKATDKVQIYSEESNQLRKEKKDCLQNSLTPYSFGLFNTLPSELVAGLFTSLISLYIGLESRKVTAGDSSAEGVFAASALCNTAQFFIVDILSSILDSKHELPGDSAAPLVSSLVQGMDKEAKGCSQQVSSAMKKLLFTRHQAKIASWLKITVVESRARNKITEEDESRIMAEYTSDQRSLVRILKGIGLGFGTIKEAVETGLSSAEEALRMLDNRAKDRRREQATRSGQSGDSLLLYKLTKSEANQPHLVGLGEKLNYRETPGGKLMISMRERPDEPKYFLKHLDESIFDRLEVPPEDLTILAAVGFAGSPEIAEFGFIIGSIQLKVTVTPQQIQDEEARKNYSFRIFVNYKGEVKAYTDPGASLVLESSDGFSFESISDVQFGVFLESNGKVALKGLAIYLGQYKGSKSFWDEEDIEDELMKGRLINYSIKSMSTTELALSSIIGVPFKTAAKTAALIPDLKQAIATVYSEQIDIRDFETDYGGYVQEFVVLRKAAELPPGFTLVKLANEGEETSDLSYYNGPVLAVKIAYGKRTEYIKAIEWRNDALFPVKKELPQDPAIVAVLIVRTTNPRQLILPLHFKLVTVGTKAVNITNESGIYHFVAYSTVASVHKLALESSALQHKEATEGGMTDTIEKTDTAQTMSSEELAMELAKFSKLSGVQLHYRYAKMERSQRSQASFQLVLKLMNRWTQGLSNSQQFSKLLEHSGSNFEELGTAIISLLQQPEVASVVTQALLIDVLTQLCKASLTSPENQPQVKRLTFESEHPYPNNAEIKETISFPGTRKMTFTFVPECKSENNYDYLRFSTDPDFSNEIRKQTGSSWPNFEAEASVVYLHFHSDGSNNDWGYKFTVDAVILMAAASLLGTKRAIWFLEQVFISEPKLSSFIPHFLKKEVINALTLFIHSSSDSKDTLRAIFLLKRMLHLISDSPSNTKSILDFFAKETISLYIDESTKKVKSTLLKSLISLLADLKEQYEFEMPADWFSNMYENFSFLHGFVTKDENFQFFVLKEFLESRGKSLAQIHESLHPYPNQFSTKEIAIRGASRIEIALSKDSEARPTDGILFTLDREGTKVILTGGLSSCDVVAWNNTTKGPNIAISNEGKTVTRTDSSGWGSAIGASVFREGHIKIVFRIDNDGGSSYLFLGLIEECNPYPLSDCTNKDMSKRVWLYRVSGEVHRHGFSTEVPKFVTGDLVTLEVDYSTQTVTFFKNDTQIQQFNDLTVPTTLIACFGGSNQIVSIHLTDSASSDPMKLSEYSVTIPGDRCFYHFPVHMGYFDMIMSTWVRDENPLLSFGDSGKTVSRQAGDTSVQTIFANRLIRAERNLLEIKIPTLAAGTALSFGVGISGQSDFPISYSNSGAIKKLTETATVDGFKAGDSVAILLNLLRGEFCVYKNGGQISQIMKITLESGKEYRWGVSVNGEAKVELQEIASVAEIVDFLGRNSGLPRGPYNKYGFKMTASPVFIGKNKRFIFEALGDLEGEWQTHIARQKSMFSEEVCEQLVNYVDEKYGGDEKDPCTIPGEDINPNAQELAQYGKLEKMSLADVRAIFATVKDLNTKTMAILPLVSLDLPNSPLLLNSFQITILRLRSSLFLKKKQAILREILTRTNTTDRCELEINRPLAARLKEKGLSDPFAMSSIFGQVYQQLKDIPSRLLRNGERIFKVKPTGEAAVDEAGPYSGVLSTVCEELHSNMLSLLVQCPNAVNNLGENRDTWVLNPAVDSEMYADMFRFVGKLVGVAIRTKNCLGLSLAPVFWKRLVFEDVDLQDVKSFDECAYQTLEILRHLDEKGITSDNFALAFSNQTFTTVDSGQRTVELLPGGKAIPVEFATASEYADLLQIQRVSEAQTAYEAIRAGIGLVIPLHYLYLFTWKQAETMICGVTDFSVDRLKEKTMYSGYTRDMEIVGWLWDVVREITPKERSLFLRFVWGRSRLPNTQDFQQFTLTKKEVEGNPNDCLPVARTCFFTLDLPMYTSKKVLKEKLLHAITHCRAIDLDKVVGAEGWEEANT